MEEVYLWYSGATDVTGKKMAEELGVACGKSAPGNDRKVVVGWGTKTGSQTVFEDGVAVLNHPDNIRLNRKKSDALRAMASAGVMVAPFASAMGFDEALKAERIMFPLVARKDFHQGGKGFWMCPTRTHAVAAIREGADYFQNLIEIVDEYRVHVFCGKVLYAAKKSARSKEETAEAYVRQELESQRTAAEKHGIRFDETTARAILSRQAARFAADGPDMLIRSNRLGWKFEPVDVFPEGMGGEAVKAVESLGLDFGAVDCCVDPDGYCFVLEVNTGPGLEGSAFRKWSSAMRDKIAEILAPAAKIQPEPEKAPEPSNGIRQGLKNKVDLMSEMIEKIGSDEEAAVLNAVFSKMFENG